MENLERDFNILEQITQYSYAIYEIYSLLHEEELRHGTDTVQYAEFLELLKSTKQEEDDLYQSLELTPAKANLYSNYLITTSTGYKKYDDRILDAFKTVNRQSLVDFRMLYRLEEERSKDVEAYEKWLVEMKALRNLERVEDFVVYSALKKAIMEDIERAFLYFNGESFSGAKENFKILLNRVKYDLLFISQAMEDTLITDENSFQEAPLFTSFFVGELRNVKKGGIMNIQAEEGIRTCGNATLNLVAPNFDKNFTGNPVYYDYLKAGLSILLLLDNCNELVASLKGHLYSINKRSNGECSNSLNSMITFIDKFQKEKPKCKYLHFDQKQ